MDGRIIPQIAEKYPVIGEFVPCKRCAALEQAAAKLLRALEAYGRRLSYKTSAWVRAAEVDLSKVVGSGS